MLLAAAVLAAGCQVAPMGTGLMDTGGATDLGYRATSAQPLPPESWGSAPGLVPSSRPDAPSGLLDLLDRPAERALLNGLRAYDDAQYGEAETHLKRALEANLASPRDRAAARKQLAFIYCTTSRPQLCEAEFRAALKDDPGFALSRGEAGHPMWGPVYRRVKAQ